MDDRGSNQQVVGARSGGAANDAIGRRVALVIGNGKYPSSPLRNPVNDANDMAVKLKQLGFEVTRLTDADQRRMEDAIRAFGRRLTKGGVGLFFYAGHGLQVSGINYLVPVDARIDKEEDVKYECVDANRILSEMDAARNGLNIMILDACRDNPFARSFRSATRGLAQMDAPTGTFIAFATAPGSVASDGAGRNGVFTGALLNHMDSRGIEIEKAMKATRNDVIRLTDNKQVPWQSSSLTGDFYFVPGEPSASTPSAPVPPSAPSAHTQTTRVDLEDLKQEAANREKWSTWQSEMKTAFGEVEKLDRDPRLSPGLKSEAWGRVLASYPEDNPYSNEDETLRLEAGNRKAYWETKHEEAERQRLEEPKNQPASEASGKTFTNFIGQKFVLIPAGTFTMGSPPSEPGRENDERQHQVIFSHGFYIQTTEVTVGQWREFVRATGYKSEAETDGGTYFYSGSEWWKKAGVYWDNPGFSQTDSHPVTCVSWNDAQRFIDWLNGKEGASKYRLPTEAEWEYAARAGTATALYTGPLDILGQYNAPALDAIAWYGGNSGINNPNGVDCSGWPEKQFNSSSCGSYPVAQKRPNGWGLYDMIGNVWEWCQDWYAEGYPSGSVTDPTGPSSGSVRVDRGGGWDGLARYCRSARRSGSLQGYRHINLGFRLVKNK